MGDFVVTLPFEPSLRSAAPPSLKLSVYFPKSPSGANVTCDLVEAAQAGDPISARTFPLGWAGGVDSQQVVMLSVPSGGGRILVAEAWSGAIQGQSQPSGTRVGRACVLHDVAEGKVANDLAHQFEFTELKVIP